jgi:hypothetical protein
MLRAKGDWGWLFLRAEMGDGRWGMRNEEPKHGPKSARGNEDEVNAFPKGPVLRHPTALRATTGIVAASRKGNRVR